MIERTCVLLYCVPMEIK